MGKGIVKGMCTRTLIQIWTIIVDISQKANIASVFLK
jgi:hypothetical protein